MAYVHERRLVSRLCPAELAREHRLSISLPGGCWRIRQFQLDTPPDYKSGVGSSKSLWARMFAGCPGAISYGIHTASIGIEHSTINRLTFLRTCTIALAGFRN
jgi:hypothetical protein